MAAQALNNFANDLGHMDQNELANRIRDLQTVAFGKATPPNMRATYEAILNQSLEELQRREQASQKSDIESILNQGVQSSSDQAASDAISRQALEDIFNVGKTSGTNTINEAYAGQRGQAIDEAAAAGLLRTPGFLTKSLAGIDAQKGNSLRDLLLGLEGQRASSKLGFEDTLYNRGQTALNNQRTFNLSKAGLNQAGNQFQQNIGLQNKQFDETKRQNTLQDIFNQQALDQSTQLGRLQADASKPSGFQQFAQVTSGLGGLLGGVGSVASAFKKKRNQRMNNYG